MIKDRHFKPKQRAPRPSYTVRPNLLFKNRMNEGTYVGDLINEEEIEGKSFYVVKTGGKIIKLSKEAFNIIKQSR